MIEGLMPFFELAVKVMAQLIKDEVNNQLQQEQNKPVTKLYYNLKELEQLTGISYLGLKGRIKRGTLKASKNANKWLVSNDEVQKLIDDLNRKKRA